MMVNMVSTKEVASMLHVTETTVKRWADENVIPCVRTAGGHRKFLLKDVASFAENKGYPVGGSQPPPMNKRQLEQLQMGVFTQDYAKIANVLKEEALQCDRDGLEMLLLYLYKQHLSLSVVLDEVIRPGFREIGDKWENGTLEVDQEHAASHVLTEALVRTVADLHRKQSNTMSALCACPEGELHEIGLRGLAYSLECEGWKVHYLGANTPTEAITSYIRANRPELVCISVTIRKHRGEFADNLKKIASPVHAHNGKLIVGGNYAAKLEANEIRCDHIADSIQDAISFVRDVFQLKPGPKKAL